MSKMIVTITPPTPNGNLHLGHISGPFLAADIFARVNRLKGHEVVFLCYSDDYQSYVQRKALELSRDRFELAGHFAGEIEKTLERTQISLDWFLKAYNNRYFEDAVTFFYERAHQKGAILGRSQQVPYLRAHGLFGYEAFGRGTCNYCGHESDASQCEFCAQAPDLHKMGEIRGTIYNGIMDWKEVDREFLAIGRYREYLREYYAGISLRPYLRDFIAEVLSREDLDWPIDRPGECGIDIDTGGHSNIIHTWFSGIAGYLAAFTEFAHTRKKFELVRDFWYASETRIVHFIGFDCSFSHAIVYPSLIHNCDGMTRKVHIFPNRFLKLENEDFSTSRGVAIWMNDILKEAPLSAVRFYLALHSPEEETSNFERAKFHYWTFSFFLPAIEKIRSVLAGPVAAFNEDHLLPEDKEFTGRLLTDREKFQSLENFSIRGIAAVLNTFLDYISHIDAGERYRIQSLGRLYAVIGMCVHPDLSDQLNSDMQTDVKGVLRWMDERRMIAAFRPANEYSHASL